MADRDAQTLTATSTTTSRERDACLFGYKRSAAENRINGLFNALEAGDVESARQDVEDLLYTIRRAATFQGIDLNIQLIN